MKESLHDSPFLFALFHKKGDDFYASTNESDNPYYQLEIEKSEESICTSTLDSILPFKIIDDKMRYGFADNVEGLPMGSFKLTILSDGFAIGYYLNHSIFDHASIFYIIKYLSHIYSYGRNNISLEKPDLKDIELVFKDDIKSINFKDIEEVRMYGEIEMGFKYNPISAIDLKSTPTSEESLLLILKFNSIEINKLKNMPGQYLSTNDIIHAILLKIYTFNSNLLPTDNFCLRFACNMRKRCGLGDETIASVVHLGRVVLKIEDIRNKTITELAIINRQCLSKVNIDNFKKDIAWNGYIQKYNENPLNYLANSDPLTCRITNWTTFDYDNIKFDSITPSSLISPCLALYGVNPLVFEINEDNQKIITTSISLPKSSLNSIKELEQTTNLFSYIIQK